MAWPEDAPANDLEEVAEAVRAKYPSDAALPEDSPLRTTWLFGDGNLPDNRGWSRITVWVDAGKESPNKVAQDGLDAVITNRSLRYNFRLWAKDTTSGQLRVKALYAAINDGIGASDIERTLIDEKWQGFKGKTLSGWQVTLQFSVMYPVKESDTRAFERAELDPDLPPFTPKQPVNAVAAAFVVDGQSFQPDEE